MVALFGKFENNTIGNLFGFEGITAMFYFSLIIIF
jgi:hypothetical protein